MFALLKDNKFTGTLYEELTQAHIDHANQYGLTFAKIEHELERDEETFEMLSIPTEEEIEEGRIAVIQFKLAEIDKEYKSDRSWREYVIANPNPFSEQAVARMQEAEEKANVLRQEI